MIVYFDRSRLYFYGGNVAAPLALDFSPESIRDSEIINEEKMFAEIDAFIKDKKISAQTGIVVFSPSSCFVQVAPASEQKQAPNETQSQSEMKKASSDSQMSSTAEISTEFVPFDKIAKVEIVKDKKRYLVATNLELVTTLKQSLIKRGFVIETVSPAFVLYGNQAVATNQTTLQTMLKYYNTFKQTSFMPEQQQEHFDPNELNGETYDFEDENSTSSNMRLYLMIGFMVILGAILAFLLYNRQRTAKELEQQPAPTLAPAVQKKSVTGPTGVDTDTPTASTSASPSQSAIDVKGISVRILNGSGIAGQAGEVEALLKENGFETISTGNATVQTQTTQIVFKPEISNDVRSLVVDSLKDLLGTASTSQNAEIDVDILITTSVGN
ncbi:LytR C-terminal domain-containing protein [Candidatus Woesebacteria bacterium]|nr:LytR C-terminal domain-containing protein [Candidatus Woesebacteria bacterium]